MDASPCPDVLPSDTQVALVAADHPQSRVVVTEREPVPPASGNDDAVVLIWSWHLSELGAAIPVEVCVDVHAEIAAIAIGSVSAQTRSRRPIVLTSRMHAACQPQIGPF